MMTAKGKITMLLITLTFLVCKGTEPAWAASPQEGKNMASTPGTRVEYITDPSMNNMNAIAVTIPEKWHFQGVLFQGGSLPSLPYFVFRASSPDGLSFVERQPQLCWVWGEGPRMPAKPPGCMLVKGPMSARELLKNLAATLKLEYVADVPVPGDLSASEMKAAQASDKDYNFFIVKSTADLARATVRYQNGTFLMKGLLHGEVVCREQDWRGRKAAAAYMPDTPPSTIHNCEAVVRYLAAPEAQYEAVKEMWDSPEMGGHILAPWNQAMLRRIQQWGQMVRAQQGQMASAQMQWQQRQFEHDQAVRQRMHEQFMASMQRGTDLSMARAEASMNAQSRAASDWVDYALDQQTVLNPETGQLSKAPSAYTYTWVESTGHYSYQTNDPNANPNGSMQGIWTKRVVVHGNGEQ